MSVVKLKVHVIIKQTDNSSRINVGLFKEISIDGA